MILDDLSNLSVTFFAVLLELIAPLYVEPFVKLRETVESLSAVILPVNVCFLALIFTLPPLEPEVPHCDVPLALNNVPEPKLNFVFVRLITALVLVTKNIGALL